MSNDGGWIERKRVGGNYRPRKAPAVHWFPVGERKSSCGFLDRAQGDMPYDWRGTRRVCGHCERGDRPEPWWHDKSPQSLQDSEQRRMT